jgi:small subunit ribosomal protein S13
MIYIFETQMPLNKSIPISLSIIPGIGYSTANLVCKKLGFSKNLKIENLSKEQTVKLVKTIEFLKLNLASDLKKFNSLNLKTLISMKSYRGLRKIQGLPIRGQRTHTNAKTAKKKTKTLQITARKKSVNKKKNG